jgi:RND family efflux transporter MFP subunit
VREAQGVGPTISVVVDCVLAALLMGCGSGTSKSQHPPEVQVATVVQQDVRIYSEWVGTLDGYVNAQIQPQVTGYLIKQDYSEGSSVAKDQVLFEIDPRPFQAALDQARAHLAQADAQLGNAVLNVKRDQPEAEAGAISQSQLDGDTQSMLAARAAVAAGRAAVEQAELNLSFTRVRALIGGIAGIAQVQVGNLVGPTSVLTGVSQVNPIKVYFPISANEYLRLVGKSNDGTVDLLAGKPDVALQLVLSDGTIYPMPGHVLFADRQVDQQTGTIRIAGVFPNPNNILRPGQYGRVRTVTEVRSGALLIPQRAVTELQGLFQVAVVGTDNKVNVRSVQMGERVDSNWVVEKGLSVGERVVAEGTQKARDGSTVAPVAFKPSDGST